VGTTEDIATEDTVRRLLASIESRDLGLIHDALSPEVSWQNVPHEAASGRDAVMAMLAPIVTWSDHVEWQVLSSAYDREFAWLERVDRFTLDGTEHAVRCCGVFTVDPDLRVVSAVRDYVDLGEWRTRIAPVYQRLANRSALDVVRRHLDAVGHRDVVAMAADYTLDARLVRDSVVYGGWREIRGYFHTVPVRLAGRELRFDTVEASGDAQVRVAWTIWDDRTSVASGVDTYTVLSGRIVEQTVVLDASDF
jgi:limonene-1,2-epoxide hydrolase